MAKAKAKKKKATEPAQAEPPAPTKLSIQRFEQLPKDLAAKQEEAKVEFGVGDLFFKERNDGELLRIREIRYEKEYEREWQVKIEHADDWEGTKWESYTTISFDKFIEVIKEGEYIRITRPLTELTQEADDILAGKISTDVYYQNEYADAVNDNHGLIHRSSKASLQGIHNALEQKQRSTELVLAAVRFQMERKRQELEAIKDKLYGAVAIFQKQVERIMRIITTIELYLGVDEELHQIRDGVKADAKTPITFRQRVLFIDEEVGAHERGGLDWRDIKEFDEWLVTGKNLNIVLPEQKGIVVLRPRREHKEYSDNAYLNAIMNIPNMTHTYILIRNGQCLYRIFTEKLVIPDRLFPKKKELQQMYDEMTKEDWDHYKKQKKEAIEDALYEYKKRAVLIQGLVDRTEIFHPLPVEKLDVFNLQQSGDYVNFVYDDDDNALPDGRLRFKDWWDKMNAAIKPGSRILITGEYNERRGYYGPSYNEPPPYAERFYLASNSGDGLKNVPDLPQRGVYEVEEFTSSYVMHFRKGEYEKRMEQLDKEKVKYKALGKIEGRSYNREINGSREVFGIKVFGKTDLTIMYKPSAEARKGWNYWDTHDRKVRTRFRIYRDDDFVINYDQIALSDIEFYLFNRADRPSYLTMMPLLKELRNHLIEEAESEEAFKDLIFRRNASKMDHDDLELAIKEGIYWWKFKNQWKRAISKDDALALRMIEKRILSPNYKRMEKQKTF